MEPAPSPIDPKNYPTAPGVYLMKDADGVVLYVGKAKSLRARLRSYVAPEGDGRPQIRFLLQRVDRVDVIVTDTEKEALILENTLIKEHRPRYNVDLRDDKTYVSLRLDLRQPFPALEVVREVTRDGAQYFGPYSSTTAVKSTLKEISRIFPLRHYATDRCFKRQRPCLYHQIGQCSAPCHGLIDREGYGKLVQGVVSLLQGRAGDLVARLTQDMQNAATAMRFEEAARLRDQIRGIGHIVEQQKVVDADGGDQDVFGLCRSEGEVIVSILHVRRGKLVGSHRYPLRWSLGEDELLAGFIAEHYRRDQLIPREIILPILPDGADALAEWLSEERGAPVRLLVPQRGVKKQLVAMADKNAAELVRDREEKARSIASTLAELQSALHLQRPPRRIECFDISTFQGDQNVGSMAVLIDGLPAPAQYRRYKITTVVGTDDFGSLREVLTRRIRRGKEEGLPDLLLIDGGRGQLAAVEEILRQEGVEGMVDLVGIAKSRVIANAGGSMVERSEERFFLPGRKNPVVLRRGSAPRFLLERVRDEAHRFAIGYHRKLRGKKGLASELEEIVGVGEKRRKILLKAFGSVKKIREAALEELLATPDLPAPVAEKVFSHFHPPAKGEN